MLQIIALGLVVFVLWTFPSVVGALFAVGIGLGLNYLCWVLSAFRLRNALKAVAREEESLVYRVPLWGLNPWVGAPAVASTGWCTIEFYPQATWARVDVLVPRNFELDMASGDRDYRLLRGSRADVEAAFGPNPAEEFRPVVGRRRSFRTDRLFVLDVGSAAGLTLSAGVPAVGVVRIYVGLLDDPARIRALFRLLRRLHGKPAPAHG